MQENKENITVEILDSMMGSGKTTAILQWIDNKCNTERFIYVSPLLSEVEHGGRIHRDCKVAKFNSPETDNHHTKSDHLLELLQLCVQLMFKPCCSNSNRWSDLV